MPMRMISVIGSSAASKQDLDIAESLGEIIARRGAAVVCGGLGGVMEAVCRGAKRAGGITVGIIPTDRHEDANEYVDIVIPTGLGYSRNFLVARTGHAVIAVDGMAGTLSEMAIAWFSDRPVVAIASSGGWAGQLAGKRIDDRRPDIVYAASGPEDAVDHVFRVLGWSDS